MRIALLVFLPLLTGPAAYALGRRREVWRDNAGAFLAAGSVLLSVSLVIARLYGEAASLSIPGVLAGGLSFTADGFRSVYSLITSVMWLGTSLFAREYFRREREGLDRYWMFTLMTLGATQGVMLSADLMTTFVFFEILSLTSFTWVMHEQTPGALRAGYTYLFIAIFGGLVLLMGLFLLYDQCGTLAFGKLGAAASRGDPAVIFTAAVCVLLGFGAKAGMFPLHVWLPMAHPVAPSPASALLSGILTKVGIYGILMTTLEIFADSRPFGALILVLGLVTMFLGAVLALCSVNLKRTLACSSMSQIGFILTGIGSMALCNAAGETAGAALALSGAVLHMVNHSMLKLLLFMAAGVVVMNLHVLTLDQIRGWGRKKYALHIAFLLGALGISGVPLFNGYLSKSMLHEGLVHLMEAEEGWLLHGAEWIFLISGGCTFAYMLKLYRCLFWEKNTPKRQARFDRMGSGMNPLSTAVILLSALFPVLLGLPGAATALGSFMTGTSVHFSAFAWENLKGALISLGIGGAVYAGIAETVLRSKGSYVNRWPVWADLEGKVYRPLFQRWLPETFGPVAAVFAHNVVLVPLCRNLVLAGTLIGRVLADSLDAVLVLLRRTVVREVKIQTGQGPIGRLRQFERASEEAFRPLRENFSFAMLMACLGILLIFGLLVWML